MRTSSTISTPPDSEYFDCKSAAAKAGPSVDELRALVTHLEADYPDDLVLREMYVLRACNAITGRVIAVCDFVNTGRAE